MQKGFYRMIKFICYTRCSTCKKAQKYLDDHGIRYEYRDIAKDNPSEAELRKWHKISHLELRKFFNTSGILYREMNLKDRLKTMSEDEQFKLLSTNGLLVKRPLLISDKKVLVGFRESDYKQLV